MATYIRFRVPESHILQVRPKLPQAIGNGEYIAYGMPSLASISYYQGMSLSTRDDKRTDGRATTLALLIPHAANAGYAGLQCVCARCATRPKTFEQQTATAYKMEQSYLEIICRIRKEAQRYCKILKIKRCKMRKRSPIA